MYLLTGPVIEAVHSEPVCPGPAGAPGVTVNPSREGNRRLPVDRPHVCVICTQSTERLTTTAIAYHLSPLRRVSILAVLVFPERPVPVRFFSPDKRGPPPLSA